MTVLSFERHPVDPSSVEAFERLASGLVAKIRDAPGALWADVARAMDDDPSFLVLSEWRTGADLEAWTASEPARSFEDETYALLRGDVTRRRLTSA